MKKQLIYSLITFSLALVSGTQAAEAASLTVVADGLDQPRGFAFGSDGTLYIPEPGIGGDGQCQPSPSTLFQPICFGNTGAFTVVSPDGEQKRIFDDYQSLAEQPAGTQGAGPADIAFNSSGNAYLITGYAGFPGNRDLETNQLSQNYPLPEAQTLVFPPSEPDELLGASDLAKLYEFDVLTGEQNEIFDFAEAEIILNPDNGDSVTNPYDLEIEGDTAYVVDGGGNSAYKIELDGSGDFEVFAIPDLIVSADIFETLPPPPEEDVVQAIGQPAPSAITDPDASPSEGASNPFEEILPGLFEPVPGQPDKVALQSVSTGGAIGPDGALYVGEYTGFPYPLDAARIFRIGEDGEVNVFAEGFNYITDIQFDKDGNLYVLEFSDIPETESGKTDTRSSLVKVTPDGTRTTVVAPGEGLLSADGIAFGPDGSLYVANRAIGPDVGEIVRVDLGETPAAQSVPEPSSLLSLLMFGIFGGGMWWQRKQKQVAAKITTCQKTC